MLNLHHLELFFYVARHRGIVRACAEIPYGIQQPAVSAQLLALESDLGTRLFQRRPFRLTPAGEALYSDLAPFFGRLPEIEAKLRGTLGQELRIAGPAELLRYHVPEMAIQLGKRFPRLRLRVFEGHQHSAQERVESGEAGIAVTAIEQQLGSGFRLKELTSLPLALLHRKRKGMIPGAAATLSRGNPPADALIAPPPREVVTRTFARELHRRNCEWPVMIEAGSGDQIAAYVTAGMGIGLWVEAPGVPAPEGVRVETLPDFPAIAIGAFWLGTPTPVEQAFLDLLEERVARFQQR